MSEDKWLWIPGTEVSQILTLSEGVFHPLPLHLAGQWKVTEAGALSAPM